MAENGIIKTVTLDGFITYELNGMYHREDGPAKIWPNGSYAWYFAGHRHREDGPALFDAISGHEEWFRYGQIHRIDGPARSRYGEKREWFLFNRKHTFNDWLFYNDEIDEEDKTLLKLEYG